VASTLDPARRERLPAWPLAVAYFAFAHLALLGAWSVLIVKPGTLMGFYYHPHAIAVTHLFTLGWISSSILGSLYLIGPIALSARLPGRPVDGVAFVCWVIGVSGMVSHFWLGSPSGTLWSAALVVAVAALVGARVARSLRASSLPGEVRLHFELSLVNLLLAALLGMSVAFSRLRPILPTDLLHATLAHAHLAALGWTTLMVLGAGYRLLPMLLPAAMPRGGRVRATAWLMEAGVLGLVAALLYRPQLAPLPAALCLASLGLFFANVRWMLRHRRPPATNIPRPDFGVWQVHAALLCVPLAVALGVVLLFSPNANAGSTGLAKTYAALGLLGFLAQMVVGMEGRILPWAAWLWGSAHGTIRLGPGGYDSPYALLWRPLQAAVLFLWLAGLPTLIAGLAGNHPAVLRGGAVLLAVATAGSAVQTTRLARIASHKDSAGWRPS
jgi:hypothetical protein